MSRVFVCMLTMMLVTYIIRAVPFTLARRRVRNRFLRAFLYYVPYAVLTAMTIPAVFTATPSTAVSAAGFLAAVILAYRGKGLVTVSLSACAAAFVCMFVMQFLQ